MAGSTATGRQALRSRLEAAGRAGVVPPDKGFEQWLDQHLRTHRQDVELVESTVPRRGGHPVVWITVAAALVVAIIGGLLVRGDNAPQVSGSGAASTVVGSTASPASSTRPATSVTTGATATAPPSSGAGAGAAPTTATRVVAGDATILGGARVRVRWLTYPEADFSSYVLVRGRVGARPQYPAAGTDVVVATINDRTATVFVDSVRVAGNEDPVYLVVVLDHQGRVVARSGPIRARVR